MMAYSILKSMTWSSHLHTSQCFHPLAKNSVGNRKSGFIIGSTTKIYLTLRKYFRPLHKLVYAGAWTQTTATTDNDNQNYRQTFPICLKRVSIWSIMVRDLFYLHRFTIKVTYKNSKYVY